MCTLQLFGFMFLMSAFFVHTVLFPSHSLLCFHLPSTCHLFIPFSRPFAFSPTRPYLWPSISLFFPLNLPRTLSFHASSRGPPQDQGSFCCRGASWTPQTGWTRPRSCCTTSRTPAGPGSASCVDDASSTPVSTSVTQRQVSRDRSITSVLCWDCHRGNRINY